MVRVIDQLVTLLADRTNPYATYLQPTKQNNLHLTPPPPLGLLGLLHVPPNPPEGSAEADIIEVQVEQPSEHCRRYKIHDCHRYFGYNGTK